MTDNVLSIDEFKQRKADSNAVQGCMDHLNDLYSLRREKMLRLSTESFIRPVMDILKNYIVSLGLRMQNVKDILDAIDFCVEVDSDVPIRPASQRNYTFPFSDKVPVCASFKIADSLAFAAENKAHLVNNDHAVFAAITMAYCTSGEIFEGVYGEVFKLDIDSLLKKSDEFIAPMDPESGACSIFFHELLEIIDDEGYIFFKLLGKSPFHKRNFNVENIPDKTYLATRGDVIIRLDVYAKRYFKHVNTLNGVISSNEENYHGFI